MTSVHQTAYPRRNADPSVKDLTEVYTPTADEVGFGSGLSHRPTVRIAVLLHLKLFQSLGYFIRLENVPIPIHDHVVASAALGRCSA